MAHRQIRITIRRNGPHKYFYSPRASFKRATCFFMVIHVVVYSLDYGSKSGGGRGIGEETAMKTEFLLEKSKNRVESFVN